MQAKNVTIADNGTYIGPQPGTNRPGPVYADDEFSPGIRNLSEWFSWSRENVSGKKDMYAHATVYGYRMIPNYTWGDVSWAVSRNVSAPVGQKWLFVFVNFWSGNETICGTNDPRFWNVRRFVVQYKDQVHNPVSLDAVQKDHKPG